MLIVLILFGIIFIVLIVILAILLSTLRMEIKKFEVNNKDIDYLIYFRLYLFNKIRILGIKIDKKRLVKIEGSKTLKFIDHITGINIEEELNDIYKVILKMFKKDFFKTLKRLKIKMSKLQVELEFGTEDVIATSFLTGIIASSLAIAISRLIDKFDKTKYSYKINPLYLNKNSLKLNLNCTIYTKMVHIINVVNTAKRKKNISKNHKLQTQNI